MDAAAVRNEALSLADRLECDSNQLKKEELTLEKLKADYEQFYRAKARALAEEMLSYVPDSDPRVMMPSRMGNLRTFRSNDITMIENPVPEEKELAESQLQVVANILRQLVAYLPSQPAS